MTTTSLINCPSCGRSAQIATEGRSIHFCPTRVGKKVVSRDYAGYYDGVLRASGGSYLAVEQQLDEYVYELLADDHHLSATALDGGSDADVMAAEVAGMVAGGDPCDAPYLLAIPTSIKYDAATCTYDLLLVTGEFVGIAHTEAEAQAALGQRVTPAYLVGYQAGVAAFARLHATDDGPGR